MQQHARPHPRASSVRSLARGGMRALSASSAPACQEGGRRRRGPQKWYNAPGPAPDGLRRGVSGAASALIHCRVSRCSELARCSGPPTEVRCPHHRGTGESLPHACRWWQIGSPNGLERSTRRKTRRRCQQGPPGVNRNKPHRTDYARHGEASRRSPQSPGLSPRQQSPLTFYICRAPASGTFLLRPAVEILRSPSATPTGTGSLLDAQAIHS